MRDLAIETERLVLRPPRLEDFERWADAMADEETARYVGGVQPKPMVWRSMMTVAGAWQLTGVSMFSVIERASGLWIGRIGPWQPHGWPGTEVGWTLHRDAWGKGYALEAATAAMNYAFDTLGWTDIIHCIEPRNVRSIRLAERLGSKARGTGKLPPPHDKAQVGIWGQTHDEWKLRIN
jgi:RimJ/RimL family protein N-acetyltransferase